MTLSITSLLRPAGRKFVLFQRSGRMNENLLRIADNDIFLRNTFHNNSTNIHKLGQISKSINTKEYLSDGVSQKGTD
jgi:hypothetical protein